MSDQNTFLYSRIGLSWFYIYLGTVIGNWVSRLPQIKADQNMSDGDIGLVLVSAIMGALCGLPLVTIMINSIGSAKSAFIGAVITSILVPVIGLVDGWLVLVLGIAGLGFGMGIAKSSLYIEILFDVV